MLRFFLSLITSPISIAIILIVIIYLKHRGGLAALPEHLKWQIHKDYSFILQLIPRTLTSYNLFRPPRMLVGYNVTDFWWLNGKKGAHPIQRYLNGKRFSWHINWPLFFSLSYVIKGAGYYLILGWRPDAVDFYATFPCIIPWAKIGRFEP